MSEIMRQRVNLVDKSVNFLQACMYIVLFLIDLLKYLLSDKNKTTK